MEPVTDATYRWGHRPVLTQLRFVAVVLVLAFHAGLLDHGFVGVDVFFVLSGFLISNVLWEALHRTGSVRRSLAEFYVRRVKRLLPMATLVLTATALATWAWFDATADQVGSSVRASALWFQNWNLISAEGDYFAPDGTNPFIHFWSLSIEEQFYLVAPVMVLGALRVARGRSERVRLGVVGALAASGVALSLWANVTWSGSETARYYATHTRAYQLLLGVLAMAVIRRWPSMPRRGLVPALLALIGVSVFGAGSLLATGVAAALVATALVVTGEASTRRRPLVEHLGDLSYGVYLWHYPVNEYLRVEEGLSSWVTFGLTLVISHALAEVSHRLVEKPIRVARVDRSRRVYAPASVAVVVVLLVPAVISLDRTPEVVEVTPVATASPPTTEPASRGATPTSVVPVIATLDPTTTTAPTTTTIAPDTHQGPLRHQYRSVPVEGTSVFRCGIDDRHRSCVATEGDQRVLLLGDSFMEQLFPALHTLALEQGWQLSTFMRRGCPWQLDVYQALGNRFTEPCRASKALLTEIVDNIEPELVIVHGFPYFTNEPQHMTSAATGEPISPERYLELTFETVALLNDRGIEVIAIETTPMPASGRSVVTCVRANDDLPDGCEFRYAHFDDGYHRALRQHATDNDAFAYVSVNDWWCDGPDCRAGFRGHVVMADLTHTSSSMLLESRGDLLNLLRGTGAFD